MNKDDFIDVTNDFTNDFTNHSINNPKLSIITNEKSLDELYKKMEEKNNEIQKLNKNIHNIVKIYENALHENIVKNNTNIERLVAQYDARLEENNKNIDRLLSIYDIKLKETTDMLKKHIRANNKRCC